jgi:hypothetical protein
MNFLTESILNGRLVPTCNRHAGSGVASGRSSGCLTTVAAKLRNLAPYAAIELVLPGGSLIALLLWFYRRRQKAGRSGNPLGMHLTTIH